MSTIVYRFTEIYRKNVKTTQHERLSFCTLSIWYALPPSTITLLRKQLWPDIIPTSRNDLQISVTSELIEQVAAETQISSEDVEIWCRNAEIINQVSNFTTINQEEDDDVITTTLQLVTAHIFKGLKRMMYQGTKLEFRVLTTIYKKNWWISIFTL